MFVRLAASTFVAVVALIGVEAVSFVGVMCLKKRLVFYNPPRIDLYYDYMANRDPVLGWPSKKMLKEKYGENGARPIPSSRDASHPCISLYGDSFTWSDSVSDHDAWSNQLAILRKCHVNNFGVPGYGTDQAYLRYVQNQSDNSPVVILNHFTGDIRRNVTQFRNLTSNDEYFLLKPRYVLDNGNLKLIPLLSFSPREAEQLALDPERVLQHEFFLPNGPSGIVKASFPYSRSLIAAFDNEHLKAKFLGKPVWEAYYHDNHPSGALALTIAIMKEFTRTARERNQRPLTTIIPNAHDIEYFQETGQWTYQPLVESLRNLSVETYDFGPGILARTAGKNICEFMEAKSCYGHYNAAGYKIIAELLNEYLVGAND